MAARRNDIPQFVEIPRMYCEWPGCTVRAVLKEWNMNLCRTHYFEKVEADRLKRWLAAGKPTAAQSLQKIKDKFRSFAERNIINEKQVLIEREPGED